MQPCGLREQWAAFSFGGANDNPIQLRPGVPSGLSDPVKLQLSSDSFVRPDLFLDDRKFSAAFQPSFLDVISVADAFFAEVLFEIVARHVRVG